MYIIAGTFSFYVYNGALILFIQDASNAKERSGFCSFIYGMDGNDDQRNATISNSSRQPNFRPNILFLGNRKANQKLDLAQPLQFYYNV